MSTFTDEAVVLRRVNYGEADRILTVLSREHGKLGVIARGVRKPKARLAGHTDLFARSRMHLASGRGDLLTLTQAERAGPGFALGDPVRTACAAVIAELADRTLEAHHADEASFELIASGLANVFDGSRDPRAAVVWCVRRLVDALGYAPRLQECAGCEDTLREEPAWFSASGGGLLCASCAGFDTGAVECSVRVIKVLRVIAAADAQTFGRLRLDPPTAATLLTISEREVAQHVERGLKSLDVLRSLIH